MPQRITLFRVRDEFRWFPAPEVFPHAHNNANAGISLFWGCAMLTLIQAKIERQRETRKQTRLLIFINHLNRTSGVTRPSPEPKFATRADSQTPFANL
jgi:hypothetical protein